VWFYACVAIVVAQAFTPASSFGGENPSKAAGSEKQTEADTLAQVEASTRDLIANADKLIAELEQEVTIELDPTATRELLAKVRANRATLSGRLEDIKRLRGDR
jgi:hypothetical protein